MRFPRSALAMSLLVMAGPASAADANLVAAYNSLVARKYAAAEALVLVYLARNPPRYDADFILAKSQCVLRNGSRSALGQAQALQTDYVLDSQAAKQVEQLITRCVPKPPPPPPQAEKGPASTAQMLESPDEIDTARPTDGVPKRLPRMTVFAEGISFTGGDFTERRTETRAACARLCQILEKCRAVTYARSDGACSLKSSVPAARSGSDFSSARKIVRRPPTGYIPPP